jgi:hypothetical protein
MFICHGFFIEFEEMVFVAVLARDLLGHSAKRLVDRTLVFEAVIQNEHRDFFTFVDSLDPLISAAGGDCLLLAERIRSRCRPLSSVSAC